MYYRLSLCVLWLPFTLGAGNIRYPKFLDVHRVDLLSIDISEKYCGNHKVGITIIHNITIKLHFNLLKMANSSCHIITFNFKCICNLHWLVIKFQLLATWGSALELRFWRGQQLSWGHVENCCGFCWKGRAAQQFVIFQKGTSATVEIWEGHDSNF